MGIAMKNIVLVLTSIVSLTLTTSKAQVNLNIGDGLTIETTGGLLVELSGDLEENTTGYLNGIVTSGDRGSDVLTQFAGLTITTGGVDKITRTTGTALSGSAPKTTQRSYEVENTTSVNSNISSSFRESLEANGIVNPFLYNKLGSVWTGYLDNNSSSSIIGAYNFDIPSGTSNIVISEGIRVAAKIYLEGPYTLSTMSTSLSGSFPLTSPYADDPRTVLSLPANTVDWVLLQLRDNTTPSTVISSRSVFLKNDGTLIDDLGGTGIGMPSTPDNYYIGIKHRNHLSIMSSSAQTLDWLSP